MSTALIVGNGFSLLDALCIGISVIKKNKTNLIWWQTFATIFSIFSDIALSAYTAIVIGLVALVRNVLACTNRLDVKGTWILTILCVVVGMYVNNKGIYGLLAVIASSGYTVFMYTTKNEQGMRYALVANLVLWVVHDFYIQAYPACLMKSILIVWTIIHIVKYHKNLAVAKSV